MVCSSVLFLSILCACILKGGQGQQCAEGLTKDQVFPVCPGSLVTYTCTVAGTNFTAWTGSKFFQFCNDTLNETIITHYFNVSTDLENTNLTFINASECGPFMAVRNDAETTDGCYVSDLEFLASNPAPFNGTTVECLDGDGREIGTDIVTIAGPPSKPLNLRVSTCDGSDGTLTLSWDKPASNGGSPILQYSLIVEPAVPQCSGICYVDVTETQFTFGPLNTSTLYTFTVHADNCDNATQQGDQNNITIFYGGPAGPMGLSGALVYHEDELVTIKSTWDEMVPLDVPNQCNLPVTGFEISYISHFSDPVTLNIDLERCFGGTCSHTFDIVDFDIPMYTLSVSSTSVLGPGPPTLLDFVSAKNDFVNITINASTPFPEASCQVLCGFGEAATVQCDISYSTDVTEIGQPGSPTDALMANGSLGETVSLPLTEPLPPNTTYYYQVVAVSPDQRVTVNGNFSTGNYSGECDPLQLITDSNAPNATSNTTCIDGREGVVNSDSNLLVCYNGVSPSSVADLTCSNGYNLESDGVTVNVSCLVNGLWNYYPTATCRKEKDYSRIIGGSVGGVLGLILIIAIVVMVTIYCKTSKKRTNVNKVILKYTQGASEELLLFDECDEAPESTPLQNSRDGEGKKAKIYTE